MIKQIPSINFLSDQRARILLLSKRKFVIQLVSIATMGLYGLVIASLFSFNGFQNYQIKQTRINIEKAKKQIDSYSELEASYFKLKNKTTATVEILSSLSKHQRILETVFHILPEGVYVQGVVVDDTNDIQFDATTYDVDKLHDFIGILEHNLTDGMAKIDKAAINQVNVDENGMYSFNTLLRLEVEAK